MRIESDAFSFSSLQSTVISSNIEILGSSRFHKCKSFFSISFESDSRLLGIESHALSRSSLHSIVIPSSVEILGSSCFEWCESFSSLLYESNSRLLQIESYAFSRSSLQSIAIPSQVQLINGSASCSVNLSTCLIECGNRRFVFDKTVLLGVIDHRLIRDFSGSSHITIPRDIEILGSSCFRSVNDFYLFHSNHIHD
jgi:hypothetical protein